MTQPNSSEVKIEVIIENGADEQGGRKDPSRRRSRITPDALSALEGHAVVLKSYPSGVRQFHSRSPHG